MDEKEKKRLANKKYREKKKEKDNIEMTITKVNIDDSTESIKNTISNVKSMKPAKKAETKHVETSEEEEEEDKKAKKKVKKNQKIYVESSEEEEEEKEEEETVTMEELKDYINLQISKNNKKSITKKSIFADESNEKKESFLWEVSKKVGETTAMAMIPIVMIYVKKCFLEQAPQEIPSRNTYNQQQRQPNNTGSNLNGVF